MAMTMAAARSASSSLFSRVSPLRHSRPLFTSIFPPLKSGPVYVTNHYAYVVERFRKYHKTLTHPGWHFLIPFIDRVAHVHAMKWPRFSSNDMHLTPADQSVVVSLGYVLIFKLVDPKLASYSVKDPRLETERVMYDKLASEILSSFDSVDRLLQDRYRRLLCDNAVRAANAETTHWGVKCLQCNLSLPLIAPKVAPSEMGQIKLTQVLKVA